MARPTKQILQLARIGAAVRLGELTEEIEAIRRAFPEIQKTAGVPLPRVEASEADGEVPERAGKGSRMSAAARKAVSLRMKKYWAARRKATKA